MKKSVPSTLSRIALIASVALTIAVGCASCEKAPDLQTYDGRISLASDDGTKDAPCRLTLNRTKKTFSVSCEQFPELSYSGSYAQQKGSLILTSDAGRAQKAILELSTFRLIDLNESGAAADPARDRGAKACEHEYELSIDSPGTCAVRGYKEYRCKKCNAVKREDAEYGPHDWSVEEKIAGDCKTKGRIKKKCRICGKETIESSDEYGDCKPGEKTRIDNGCEEKISFSSKCSVCGKTIAEVGDEYGKHAPGENGVCKVCGFDSTGLCLEPDEPPEIAGLRDAGYFVGADGKLCVGAWPDFGGNGALPAETVRAEGKKDGLTGYYRLRGASYFVPDGVSGARDADLAYKVKPLSWSLVDADAHAYACDRIVDEKEFLSSLKIRPSKEKGDNEYERTTVYRNINADNLANDYKTSDLKSFLETEFFKRAFSERQRKMISSVGIPDVASLGKIDASAASAEPVSDFFVDKPGSESNKTTVARRDALGAPTCSEESVARPFGVLPVISFAPPAEQP